MRLGIVLAGGTPLDQVALAQDAESAGWDAVFVWEGHYGVEAWSLLSAMAMRTEAIGLGTMLTPLPWRRPWQVASQAITLHDLSGGRAILAVGTGAVDPGLGSVGEESGVKVRAERLDEGIDVLRALWTGERRFEGRHYTVDVQARDVAVSKASIPIWCVGAWPAPASMQRVLKCDAVIPVALTQPGESGFPFDTRFRAMTQSDVAALRSWLTDKGAPEAFDIVFEGETPADDPAKAREIVAGWAEVGVTWWLDARWADGPDLALTRERIAAGPPRL